jgi:hypothetical protein
LAADHLRHLRQRAHVIVDQQVARDRDDAALRAERVGIRLVLQAHVLELARRADGRHRTAAGEAIALECLEVVRVSFERDVRDALATLL